jgi:hypothetical protein
MLVDKCGTRASIAISQKIGARQQNPLMICWAPQDEGLDKKRLWALSALNVQDAWGFSKSNGRPTRGQGAIVAQPDRASRVILS